MALMTFKPTSAGRRSAVRVVTPGLHKGAPHAALVGADTVVVTSDAVKKIEEWLA